MPDPIRNQRYAHAICDFSGLPFGFTNLDAVSEHNNRLVIFAEAKRGAEVPVGQRLALERITDAIQRGGLTCFSFIVDHQDDGDIMLANADVCEYRYQGVWRQGCGKFGVTAQWLKDRFGGK